ncbi:TPA: IpaD/SipD/SspD family type III secretion system needle tip protein [Salmonella enterica]|nr:IpaD/SipD/SspD family type III secretion system needle tip protein [Salmonella enterica]
MLTVREHFISGYFDAGIKPQKTDKTEIEPVYQGNKRDMAFDDSEHLRKTKLDRQGLDIVQYMDKDEKILERHLFINCLKAVAASDLLLSSDQRQILSELCSASTFYAPVRRTGMSDAELWEKVTGKIAAISDNYLGVYENVVAVYTGFYQNYSDILSRLGGWLLPGKDGNSIKLDVTSLKSELNQLLSKYEHISQNTVLFPAQSGNTLTGATEAQARQWLEELNLPAECLKRTNAGYVVLIDLAPVRKMLNDLNELGKPGGDSKLEMDNAKYQAWQSGFKAQEEKMKTTLQTLTQKYSNANSLYDNLVKILSSTINSCMESAKSFLQR